MPSQPDPNSIMDLDFADFESWPFDQISASPFFLPASEQPFSPVCAFADFSDDKSAVAAGMRFPPDSRFVTCNPEVPNGNSKKAEDEKEGDKNTHSRPANGITRLEVPDVFIIKERMTQALRYFKESTEHHQILAQIWAPVKCGNRYVLTTSGQPFVLSSNSNGLHQYRTVSLMYSFSVDGETDGSLGLPGRVFRQKLPEWTPDVQFYSSKEYPRVKHAKNYNVHGTLALPVLEPSGQSCVGVVELIMTSQKINYAPEVDKVCKALEAVNLRSSEILDHPNIQICNEGRQNALAEILEVLTEVCETYELPLAQTWVPCRHRSVLAYGGGIKKSCSSFDGSCMEQVCMSTTDVAFYVVDAHMWGFREACAEHHLQKGQGVAGRAFSSRGSCFCESISRFSKREYPLVHYAKMFELGSSFAICLGSRYTGEDDYVLEFFLPTRLTDSAEQHKLLDAITVTMGRHFQSLMVASGRALQEQRNYMEIVDVSIDESPDSEFVPVPAWKPLTMQGSLNGGVISPLETCKRLNEESHETDYSAGAGVSYNGVSSSKVKDNKKPSERKRGKAEKQISLEVLQRYFAGSLKDAAKSLGVCPTTMKRICRQHGISRWPSRKINKVNRSLSKLKCVIESVQGADGAFTLTSLSTSSIPVAVGSISWPTFNGSSQLPSPSSKPIDPPPSKTQVRDWQAEISNHEAHGRASSHEDQVHERTGFGLSQARSGSREASTGTSTSHGSCQGSPITEQAGNSMGLMFQPNREQNSPSPFQLPDSTLNAQTQYPFGIMLSEDSGSSKDLNDLCSSRPFAPANGTMPRFTPNQEMRSVTVKATFREDIIRFRFPLSSNILDLRDEVAKRLKLELGTFEIKYLDDDNEWVLIACDSDLQECLDIMRSSGSSIIRLSIQDFMGNPGSSCESSGE